MLGKITEIIDKNGSVMVSYTYDAWGNWINKDTASNGTTLVDDLVVVNPFIYKGYYYDSETDWYYLKSRYYCSMLSRFINMDNTNYLETGSMDGVDLFAYCGNNPVMYVDPSGNMSKFWKITLAVGIVSVLVVGSVVTGGGLGAAVGGGISTVSQIATTGDINFAQLGLDITVGAISGVIGGSEVTRLTATAFGFVLGGVSNFSSQLIQTGSFTEINYGSVLTSAFIGGAGARNKASIQKGSGVIKANNNVGKVLGKWSKEIIIPVLDMLKELTQEL